MIGGSYSSFWTGFYKKADAGLGGSGFSGVGKGNLPTGNAETGGLQGNTGQGGGMAEDTRTEKTLFDRQRNPKDFCFGHHGEDGPADSNQHIIY